MTTRLAANGAATIGHHVSVNGALAGGVVGTALMTAMMFFVAPLMLGHPMDVPRMLGDMLGGGWTVGLFAHLLNGVVIFPLAYVFVMSRILPGSPIAKAILWGVVLWIAAETMVMPLAGAGFFSAAAGGAKAALVSLIAHIAYGASFGAVATVATRNRYE